VKKVAITLLILVSPPALASGERLYTVVRGDTLSSISLRLFGDPNYWPKLWALNGKKIPNPHRIRPSTVLVLAPGSTTTMPSVALTDRIHSSSAAPKKKRSDEWRSLPPQPWEQVEISLPEDVDSLGFDLKTRYVFPRTKGMELPWIAMSDTIDAIGTIFASRGENKFLTMGDLVYIREEDEGLEEGKTLAITTSPSILKASFFSRKGYAYPILGKVKILGKKQGVWIGQIEEARASIERESCFLIENPARATVGEPIAAPEDVSANFLVERGSDLRFSAQHKVAFIDRGTNDGISEGMILRAYQYRDPYNERKISSKDVAISADVQVIQASEKFSTVLVTRTIQDPIEHGTPVVALTDVSDYKRQKINLASDVDDGEAPIESVPPVEGAPEEPEGPPAPESSPEVNDLDQLEQENGLTDEEKANLNQLEKHQESASEPQPEPTPTSAPEASEPEAPSSETTDTEPSEPSSDEEPTTESTEEAPAF
jgi:hypothetical protein